jgi:tetratricopeptide (TPR) repeat protein
MLRGWLALLALLGGIAFSYAAESVSPSLSVNKRWPEARRLLAEGKPQEAKAAFEALIELYPKEADLHLFLGIVLLRLRDPDAAYAAVKKAVAIDPSHIEARTLLGWIHSEIRGDFSAAINQYSKVAELRPDLPEAHNNLGVAQKRKGELEKAAASFTKALEGKPDYSTALNNRGWIFAEQKKWVEARRDFEQALRIDPDDDGALYGLAQALREARNYSEAQRVLGQLISRSANFVYWLEWGRIGLIRYYWVLLLIALAFYIRGRFEKARSESNGG